MPPIVVPARRSAYRSAGCPEYRGDVATNPLRLEDDFDAVVAKVRRELIAAGKNKAPAIGEYVSPLGPEERTAIMRLLRDGTYHKAAARVGEEDPELADQ